MEKKTKHLHVGAFCSAFVESVGQANKMIPDAVRYQSLGELKHKVLRNCWILHAVKHKEYKSLKEIFFVRPSLKLLRNSRTYRYAIKQCGCNCRRLMQQVQVVMVNRPEAELNSNPMKIIQ